MKQLKRSLALAATLALGSNAWAQNNAKLIYYWDFNDASDPARVLDEVRAVPGAVESSATYTPDSGGRSGQAGDRAMDFGPTNARQLVRVTEMAPMREAGATDQLTMSMWVKLHQVSQSSAFWLVTPTPSMALRGAQAHIPWDNNNIYFDTAGCCNPDTRINAGIDTFADYIPDEWSFNDWHHYVFVKNGATKQIWVDGKLFLEGFEAVPLPADFTQLIIGAAGDGLGSIQGIIDDFAVFGSPLDESQITQLAGGASPASLVVDSDSDGLPNWWEEQHGLNTGTNDSSDDPDGDGLTNLREFVAMTNPKQSDTDGDGLNDKVETRTGTFVSATDTGTNPTNPDTDGDGLRDGIETNTGTFVDAANTGTNPHAKDTDGDKYADGDEVRFGGNPVNAAVIPIEPGSVNLLAWWDFNNATTPEKAIDKVHGIEGAVLGGALYSEDALGRSGQPGDRAMDFGFDGLDQHVDVTDAAFLNVGATGDQMTVSFWQQLWAPANSSAFWMVAASNGRGFQAHAPWSDNTIYYDTAGTNGTMERISKSLTELPGYTDDFIMTWRHYAFVKNGATKQVWIDGNLFMSGEGASPLPADFNRLVIGSNPGLETIQGLIDDFAVFGSALDESRIKTLASGKAPDEIDALADSDGDGMPDIYEDANGLNKLVNDAAQDADQDGLSNLAEFEAQTNPQNDDTDGDGLKDGVETGTGVFASSSNTGTDPNKADSDGDGLSDGVETGTGVFAGSTNTGTDPNKADSDNDTYGDSIEVLLGTSPVDGSTLPVTAGGVNLLAYWDFNDATDPVNATDEVHGFKGELLNGAYFAGDQTGRSGAVGDQAVDFGADSMGQSVRVANGAFLNAASVPDKMTVSFWLQMYDLGGSSAFWMVSPSSAGSRGNQAHVPWTDENIYWDNSGCCDPAQRLNASITTFADYTPDFIFTWHNYVFVKNGARKEIWIDGKLFVSSEGAAPLPSDFTELNIGSAMGATSTVHGQMDDFAIFASALTAKQIQEIASGTSPAEIEPDASAEPPVVSISRSAEAVTLQWTGRLQSSATVDGEYSDVQNATSPMNVTAEGAQRYYRTVK